MSGFPILSVLNTVPIPDRRRHDAMTLPNDTSWLDFLVVPLMGGFDGLLSRCGILPLRAPPRVTLNAMSMIAQELGTLGVTSHDALRGFSENLRLDTLGDHTGRNKCGKATDVDFFCGGFPSGETRDEHNRGKFYLLPCGVFLSLEVVMVPKQKPPYQKRIR